MKRYNAYLAAVAVIALAAALPAFAQTNTYKAEIPFQFLAGDRTLPAGEYRIVVVPWTNRIEISAVESGDTLFLPGWTGGGKGRPGTLTFARYGNRAFLRSVDAGGRNAYLPKTRAEREMTPAPSPAHVSFLLLPAR